MATPYPISSQLTCTLLQSASDLTLGIWFGKYWRGRGGKRGREREREGEREAEGEGGEVAGDKVEAGFTLCVYVCMCVCVCVCGMCVCVCSPCSYNFICLIYHLLICL